MGGKKRRFFCYTGSLIKPLWRYAIEANFNLSGKDMRGMGLGRFLYQQTLTMPKFHFQPNFKVNMVDFTKEPASFLDMTYVNNWKQRYYLHETNYTEIKMLMQEINDHIEDIRNLQGFDDEYNDEIDYLK